MQFESYKSGFMDSVGRKIGVRMEIFSVLAPFFDENAGIAHFIYEKSCFTTMKSIFRNLKILVEIIGEL